MESIYIYHEGMRKLDGITAPSSKGTNQFKQKEKNIIQFLKISKTKLLHHSSNRKTAKWTF